MDAVGIDPSLTCTGLAVVGENRATSVHTFPTSTQDADLADYDRRVQYITGKTLMAAPKRCLTVIEAPFVPHHGGAGQVIERAWLFGFIVSQFLRRGPVVAVSAKTRAKYATGNGNASKKEVLAAMRDRFPDLSIRDDNAADGLALAAMGARWLGFPIDGEPSKPQLEAMRAVRWQSNPKESKS